MIINKRNFINILIVAIFIFGGIVNVSLSANNDVSNIGLTPDSPFYFLKTWKESIQIFFTFGEENKVKQYLHLAEVRLAEYQKMIEKGKNEIAQKTLEKYEKQLNRAMVKMEDIKSKSKDIKNLSEQINRITAKHTETLQNNLQKVSESAKNGIENAIEKSQKTIENVLNKKDETVNWEIYANDKYGYSIKYPKNISYSLLKADKDIDTNRARLRQGIDFKIDDNSHILIYVWYKDIFPSYKVFVNSGFEKIIINGQNALRGIERLSSYHRVTYVFGDDYAYEIQYNGLEKTSNIEFYDKIASTFKLIE